MQTAESQLQVHEIFLPKSVNSNPDLKVCLGQEHVFVIPGTSLERGSSFTAIVECFVGFLS